MPFLSSSHTLIASFVTLGLPPQLPQRIYQVHSPTGSRSFNSSLSNPVFQLQISQGSQASSPNDSRRQSYTERVCQARGQPP